MQFWIKPREDGRGPYRWHSVFVDKDGALRTSIYKESSDLTSENEETLRALVAKADWEIKDSGRGCCCH